MESALAHLPKAELHLHLEGCISPAILLKLAERHGEKLDPVKVAERYNTRTFPAFLDLFKWVTSYLRQPADYATLLNHLANQFHADNCRYAEITLSVGVMLLRKQNVEANFAAILEAASEKSGFRQTRVQWIFDAVRQFGPRKAMEVARLAAQMKSSGVVAFGLGGDEESLPASDFRKVFDYVASEGLHRVAHAGEMAGPQSVRDAIEILGAERIGHGIAAIHDEKLMDLLIKRQIPLEICPTSNLCTGALAKLLRAESHPATDFPQGTAFHPERTLRRAAVPKGSANSGASAPAGRQVPHESVHHTASNQPRIEDHPLPKFLARGVPVTLNSDDPAMFRASLTAEYALAHKKLGLTIAQLASIAEAGFRHSFLPDEEKKKMLDAFRAAASKLNLQ